jgi:hypothetical protein
MGFADQYLNKQKGFSPVFNHPPSEKLRFAVVIPAFCEPGLTRTLDSLWNCSRPTGYTEVLIVVNSSENAPPSVVEANLATLNTVSAWIDEHDDPTLRYLLMDKTNMPSRDAGVGLARKTGMDEALSRFNQISRPDGFILSFDADSSCDINYLTAIEEATQNNPSVNGLNVYFEHPVSGTEFPENVYRGIIDYELHLRYINQFLRFAGFPFAYHTIGSCFGIRANVYAAQGGMNKRKAGEDFYFLHKIIPLGHFAELNTTRVIPSPRPSDRVPFGTGVAVGKYLSSNEAGTLTYAPECFLTLRLLLQQVERLFRANTADIASIMKTLPKPLSDYLQDQHAGKAIGEINANSRSVSSFTNRFFRWFDAFRIVKYLNYASRDHFRQIPVREAAVQLMEITGSKNLPGAIRNEELLMMLRAIERKGGIR